jgi:ribosomal protein L7Ae-like RNA K-turn-binding protein
VNESDLALIGLAMRAGALVVGAAGVRAAVKRGQVSLIVVANDHSRRTEEKVVRLAKGKGVRVQLGPQARELGRLLGRAPVQAVGVTDPQLAGGIGTVSASNEA